MCTQSDPSYPIYLSTVKYLSFRLLNNNFFGSHAKESHQKTTERECWKRLKEGSSCKKRRQFQRKKTCSFFIRKGWPRAAHLESYEYDEAGSTEPAHLQESSHHDDGHLGVPFKRALRDGCKLRLPEKEEANHKSFHHAGHPIRWRIPQAALQGHHPQGRRHASYRGVTLQEQEEWSKEGPSNESDFFDRCFSRSLITLIKLFCFEPFTNSQEFRWKNSKSSTKVTNLKKLLKILPRVLVTLHILKFCLNIFESN